MGTLTKNSVSYADYNTSAGDLAVTLTAVIGKEYEIRNSGSGGNDLTITYGSNSIVFKDGGSGRFTFDGSGWSAQFNSDGKNFSPAMFTTAVGNQTAPTNIAYVTPLFDIGGGLNPATGIYTCPKAGTYDVSYQIMITAVGEYRMQLVHNGNAYVKHIFYNPAATFNSFGSSVTIPMKEGDTIYLGLALAAGPTFGDGSFQYLSIAWVAP